MIYFWADEKNLYVDGHFLSPEDAYKKFADNKDELKNFVKSTRRDKDEKTQFLHKKIKDNKKGFANKFIFEKFSDIKAPLTETDKKNIIEVLKKIQQIFKSLELKCSEKFEVENAYKIFEYLIKNSKQDYNSIKERNLEEGFLLELNDAYRCLIEGRTNSQSDTNVLSLLFRMVNIDSRSITIAEKGFFPSDIRDVVKLNIKNESFICDPTLIRDSINNGVIPELSKRIFMFKEEDFFKKFYPNHEHHN